MPTSAGDATEHVGNGSELRLNDLRLSDTGTYMCTASNSQGSVTAQATVRVTGQLGSATFVIVLIALAVHLLVFSKKRLGLSY